MLPSVLASATRRRAVDAAITFASGDINDTAAFSALCQAVGLYLETQREADSTPTPTVPFGAKKGQPLSALASWELESLERYVTDSLRDREKQKYRTANLHLRAALLAELHQRSRRPDVRRERAVMTTATGF